MTKAYKLEIMVIDVENLGLDAIEFEIENACRHAMPVVMDYAVKEIGLWDDHHPLNKIPTMKQAFKELFND